MKKKILAGLLALCMIFSMVPMSAMAAEGDSNDETPAAGATPQVVAAPLGDKSTDNAYTPAQLNLEGYKVEVEEDTTTSKPQDGGITAIYNVTVTHPALLKHKNTSSAANAGLWVGIGVPITTKGQANGSTGAGQSGNGSAYFPFVTKKTDFSEIVTSVIKNDKFTWASQASNWQGFSEYGWRQNDGTNVFQWYDLSAEVYKTEGNTPYLVERNPVKDQTNQYTYIVYRINFDVTEGHLVKITTPTNGTLTVKNGEDDVATDTPVGKGTKLTITPTPSFGYEIDTVKVGDTALTAGEDGTYTTTMADADITISATFKEKVAEPKIETIGFEWDAAAADAEINAAIKEARELESFDNVRDSDDQTFWFILSGLKNNGTYTFKVTDKKDGTVLETKVEKNVSVTEANAGKPAFYYSPLHGEFKSWKSFPPITGGTYTISVYEGELAENSQAKPVATEDFTVPAYTIPTATAHLSRDSKTLNVELSKAIRGNYKVELFKGDGTAASTTINKFFDGESKTIEFTNETEYAEGTYTVKVSTWNETSVEMFTSEVKVEAPLTDGISAGFSWTAAEANKLREEAVKAAGKTVPEGGYTDSLDQTLWFLINESVAGKHYWYEISNGGDPIWSGAWDVEEGSEARGMISASFLHTNPNDENAQNDEDVVFDNSKPLTFKVWKSESEITAKPQGDPEPGWSQTVTVTSGNDLTMLTPEANPVEKTVSVKFNRDLYGRYYIEVENSAGTVVADKTLECDASSGPALAGGTAQVFNDVTLAAGEYTVSIYQAAYDATTKKYAGKAIDEKTFTLSDDIETVDVFVGDAETASTIITAEVVADETNPEQKKIVISGTVAAPSETMSLKLVAKDAEGNEVGTLDGLTVTYADNKLTIPAGSKLTGILGTEYPIEANLTALTTAVAEPKSDVDTDSFGFEGISGDTKTAVIGAVESVGVEETSTSVITDAATKAASEEVEGQYNVTDEVIAELGEKTGDEVAAEDVKIVVIPTIKVVLENYSETIDEGTTDKSLKVDISAEYIVVATTADTTNDIVLEEDDEDEENTVNAIPITNGNKPKPLTISTAIDLSINLPTNFIGAGVDTLYVLHKNAHYHKGTVTTGKLTFTSSDGLSPFEIKSNKTSMGAEIGGTDYYDTLKDAIAAVKDGETITFEGDSSEIVSVNRAVSFTIDLNGHQFTGEIKAATGYTMNQVGDTYTFTRVGGGSGGSTVTTYPINAPTTTGGKVSVSGAAAAGATVTITTTPDEGKKVDTVTVTDANGNAIAVTNAGENRYTFVMPSSAVSVSVTFVDGGDTPNPPVWENPYSDVKEGAWYYDAVKYVTENKLMEGTGDGKFEPGTKLTRAMFAQILYNKAGKPAVTGTADYKDFKTGQWYSDAIVWATQNNVLEGYSDGRVGVSDRITREQLALMLWRYVGKPEAPADVTINGNVSSWAAEAMRWAVANGVINGDQNGNHDPRGTADRAQVAQILMNYYNK